MAVTKVKKQEILQELVDKFSKSKTVVFTGYRGLDVSGMSDLRSKLREGGSECKVAKKTLIQLAAKEAKLDGVTDDLMDGPVAVTFSYEDELSGLKALFNFSKQNDKLKLLGGIVDGKVVNAEEILQLAKLPSKEELYAKLLGSMNAPVSNMVGLLGNVLGSFVRVVNAYKDTLPADGAAPEEAPAKTEEKPAEEAEVKSDESAEAPAEDEKKEEGLNSADATSDEEATE